MIARRLTAIRSADRILVLSEQGIAEEGSHEELLNRNGIYGKVCRLQLGQAAEWAGFWDSPFLRSGARGEPERSGCGIIIRKIVAAKMEESFMTERQHWRGPAEAAGKPGGSADPDAEAEIWKALEDRLEAVWRDAGLGIVRAVRRKANGGGDACFAVNGGWTIRFHTRRPDTPAPRCERAALHRLAAAGLPVPRVIRLDESRRLAPASYLVTADPPGEPLLEAWPRLDDSGRRQLAREAGRLLAAVHGLVLDCFGPPDAPDREGVGSWYRYVQNRFRKYARRAINLDIIDKSAVGRAKKLLDKLRPALEEFRIPSLLHGSFHFGNLRQKEGRITGITGLWQACGGDPAFDLRGMEELDESCPGSSGPFRAGYESVRPLPEPDRRIMKFYRLLGHLERMGQWAERGRPDAVRVEYGRLAVLLGELEREDASRLWAGPSSTE